MNIPMSSWDVVDQEIWCILAEYARRYEIIR